MYQKLSTALLLPIILFSFVSLSFTQKTAKPTVFTKIKMMVNKDGKFSEVPVTITFNENEMLIDPETGDDVAFGYTDVVAAEYSYTKSPRWKTGLGLGAAGLAFPPLWIVAIPLGFTKHKRHWLTIRTEDEFAVLKLSKENRKILIPTFETRSGVLVAAVGDDK